MIHVSVIRELVTIPLLELWKLFYFNVESTLFYPKGREYFLYPFSSEVKRLRVNRVLILHPVFS